MTYPDPHRYRSRQERILSRNSWTSPDSGEPPGRTHYEQLTYLLTYSTLGRFDSSSSLNYSTVSQPHDYLLYFSDPRSFSLRPETRWGGRTGGRWRPLLELRDVPPPRDRSKKGRREVGLWSRRRGTQRPTSRSPCGRWGRRDACHDRHRRRRGHRSTRSCVGDPRQRKGRSVSVFAPSPWVFHPDSEILNVDTSLTFGLDPPGKVVGGEVG